jgi:hypothetical protein
MVMPQSPNPKRRKRFIFLAAICLILFAAICLSVLVLVPLPLTSRDKTRAVSHALETLFQNRRVLTDKGYSHLYDTEFMKDKSRVYFRNDLGIPDTVFLEHGLKPIPKDRKLDVDNGDLIVSFSSRDIEGKPAANIQFAYVFGNMGAHGYEIRIHKSLLRRQYFVYIHRWVS